MMDIVYFIVKCLAVFVGALYIFHLLTRKYVNPYTLDIYFGKKGCGKSCTLSRLATKYHKLGWTVFCDFDNTNLEFVHQIDMEHLYEYRFPPNSLLLIDEINLYWDNRDFAKFPKELQKWFRFQRRKRCKVIMFSQTYDCDKKLRDLADRLYICERFARIFTSITAYSKKVVIIDANERRDTAIMTDTFVKGPIWTKQFTFIPKWKEAHNSFIDDDPKLKDALHPDAPSAPAVPSVQVDIQSLLNNLDSAATSE